jgi:hypothetical protein
VFNFEQEGVQNYPSVRTEPMGGNSAFLLREKAARTKEVLTSIGRGLREQYDPAQPFSERLARLVVKIERSTREWKTEKGRKNGPT